MKNVNRKHNALRLLTGIDLSKGLLLMIATLLLFGAAPLAAQEKSADDWQYDVQIYLWGATVKGTTVTGDPITMTFGDILKNLDLAAMTTLGARKNKFSMLADVIYLSIGDSQRHNGEFLGQPVTGKLEVGLDAWVLNFIGGYNVVDSGTNQFDITAGARYLDLKLDATFKLGEQKRKIPAGDNIWDGVIGFKGRHNFSDGHYVNYYADIGGGGSKTTWQAVANFAYDYKRFTGIVGYRYLHWNLKNDAKALDDLTLHGPYISAKWSF